MPVAKRTGPCDHCAATESPMWRKGPLESPTLCNACGARFLVKKTLEGYMPKARGGVPGAPAAAGPAPRPQPQAPKKEAEGGVGPAEAAAGPAPPPPAGSRLGKRVRKVPAK